MNQKQIFIIVSITVILLAILGGYFSLTSNRANLITTQNQSIHELPSAAPITPNSIFDIKWNIYNNNKYFYTLPYPPAWKAANQASGNSDGQLTTDANIVSFESLDTSDASLLLHVTNTIPNITPSQTESTETLGGNKYTVYTMTTDAITSKTYYLKFSEGYLELLAKPIKEDTKQIFDFMLSHLQARND